MSCKCRSYNWEVGEKNEAVVVIPDWLEPEKKTRSICVDACIAHVIKYLINAGVRTLGCCCGHGKIQPNIIVDQHYSDKEIKQIHDLIAAVDDRTFTIFQWQLCDTSRTRFELKDLSVNHEEHEDTEVSEKIFKFKDKYTTGSGWGANINQVGDLTQMSKGGGRTI